MGGEGSSSSDTLLCGAGNKKHEYYPDSGELREEVCVKGCREIYDVGWPMKAFIQKGGSILSKERGPYFLKKKKCMGCLQCPECNSFVEWPTEHESKKRRNW
jgi:hypothetical protein